MKNTILLICLMLSISASAFGTALRPAELVAHQKRQGQHFQSASDLFALKTTSVRDNPSVSAEVSKGVLLDYNPARAHEILTRKPQSLELSLPLTSGNQVQIELVKVDIYAPGHAVTNSDNLPIAWEEGVYYRGVVKNMPGSIAAVSFLDGEVIAMLSGPRIGNYTLGALGQENLDRTHILYQNNDLIQPPSLGCQTPDDGGIYTTEQLTGYLGMARTETTIEVFYEVDFDIFQDRGAGTAAFIGAEFNEVATLYANENLTYLISETHIIDNAADEYAGNTTSLLLQEFQNRYGTFNGDLAQLVTLKSSGGLAAGFSGLCNNDPDESMCMSSINLDFETVPTYSFDILVQTHELGHLNGSRHTHACVWNGNNTAIDGCSGATEGTCTLPGNPSGGGTIMSYCHATTVGTNFSNGFGPQPGNVIRAAAAGADCLCPDDLDITDDVLSGTCAFTASNAITASNVIFSGANVLYSGGNQVLMNPGFKVEEGATFEAHNDGCGSTLLPAATVQGEQEAFAPGPSSISDAIQPENSVSSFLKVYPNPSNGVVQFAFEVERDGINAAIFLFNSTGKLIDQPLEQEALSAGNHTMQFDGQHLPSGIYFYLVDMDGIRSTGRLVVEK